MNGRNQSENKKMMLGLLLIVTIIVSLAGCGTTAVKNKTSKDTAKTKTYTDMAGRKVILSTNINKIVLIRSMDVYYMSAILGQEFDKK